MDNHKTVDGFIVQLYYIATILSNTGSISPAGVPVAPPLPDSDPSIVGHVIVEHDDDPGVHDHPGGTGLECGQ